MSIDAGSALSVSFRPLRREDLGRLSSWLGERYVARWWREPSDIAAVEARYGPSIDRRDPTELFVVELAGEPVGLLQRYLIDDEPEWGRTLERAGVHERAIGIDYLIGRPDRTGLGVGPVMIAAFVADSWRRYPAATVVAVAVQQGNRPSWRALEKAGFRRVWCGQLESDDPGDDGPSYVYVLERPTSATACPSSAGDTDARGASLSGSGPSAYFKDGPARSISPRTPRRRGWPS